MRMLDADRKSSVKNLQLYITTEEAKQLKEKLAKLLEDPEAREHFHLFSDNMRRDLSCSIITERKLGEMAHYTKIERQILTEE